MTRARILERKGERELGGRETDKTASKWMQCLRTAGLSPVSAESMTEMKGWRFPEVGSICLAIKSSSRAAIVKVSRSPSFVSSTDMFCFEFFAIFFTIFVKCFPAISDAAETVADLGE